MYRALDVLWEAPPLSFKNFSFDCKMIPGMCAIYAYVYIYIYICTYV